MLELCGVYYRSCDGKMNELYSVQVNYIHQMKAASIVASDLTDDANVKDLRVCCNDYLLISVTNLLHKCIFNGEFFLFCHFICCITFVDGTF